MPETCHWTEDTDPAFDVWWTTCGEAFNFSEAGPAENKMRYCCYCGLALVPVPRPPDVMEDDEADHDTARGHRTRAARN